MNRLALSGKSFRKWLVAVTAVCLLADSPAGASAPSGRYSYPNGTVSTADVVYDTVTQLTWQRTAATATYTYSGAQIYCTGLSLGGYGTGWRLPTVNELLSIVDYRVWSPAIDGIAFPATAATFFWTNTLYLYNRTAGNAWIVSFNDGYSGNYSLGTSVAVRCVR